MLNIVHVLFFVNINTFLNNITKIIFHKMKTYLKLFTIKIITIYINL